MMIAHIRPTDDQVQSVVEHCQETAVICERYASLIGANNIARVQGLLHDIGKLTDQFQKYIRNESTYYRGEIDHSYAGARLACELAENNPNTGLRDVSFLIARTIISHHGIHNWLNVNDEDYLAQRIQKQDGYAEILNHVSEIISEAELLELLDKASQDYITIEKKIRALAARKRDRYAFYMGMLERFMQSCLVDADRTNTADFMSASSTEKEFSLMALWNEMSDRLENKYTEFAKREDSISKQRCSIAERCASFAEHPVGVCRLIVPTGGGKTLSALRFAIQYCKKHGKKKIIYTAPFMSILEQNSEIFRSIAGDEFFVEHHSDFLAELDDAEELHEYELRTEKWDTPVIATTMVQLLNTLFSARSSSVRRMHRLADSVLIIDEIQSLPLKCVHIINLAINFLSRICGTTVVLCSATHPVMEDVEFPVIFDSNESMTGAFEEDFAAFHRTELISKVSPYGSTYEEAADFAVEQFREHGNLLFIVNLKSAARKLYDLIQKRCPETKVIYLSTNLCPQHRRARIQEIRTLLDANEKVICVTTQLVEAGVDISFRCVIRSLAGLDNAAQAAGRCNRNGESPIPCPVFLIKLKEEKIGRLAGVQTAQHITEQILHNDPSADYLSYKVQSIYFRRLYQQAERDGTLSYPVKDNGIQTSLLELLAQNREHYKFAVMSGLPAFRAFSIQAFRTAGSLFEVIDAKTKELLVPFNEEAEEIIAQLDEDFPPSHIGYLLRKAQKYTVAIYDDTNKKLREGGAIRLLKAGVMALDKRFYDRDYGITVEGAEQEVLII